MANRPGFNLFYIVGSGVPGQGKLTHLRLGPTGPGKQTTLDNEDFFFGRGIGAYATSENIHVFARKGAEKANDDTDLVEIVYSSGSGSSPTPVTGVRTNDQIAVVSLINTVHLFYAGKPSTSGSSDAHTIHTVSRPIGGTWGSVEDLGIAVANGVSAVVEDGSILLAYQTPTNPINVYNVSTKETTPLPNISCWHTPYITSTDKVLLIIYQGSNNDHQLYSALSIDGGASWPYNQPYNQKVTNQYLWDSATAIGSRSGLFCFYHGNGSGNGATNQLYMAAYAANSWLPEPLTVVDSGGAAVDDLLFGPCAIYVAQS